VIKGVVIAESLRTGARLSLDGFSVQVRRQDVSGGVVAGQPEIWTFLEVEGPDDAADALATALAGALEAEGGWYADYGVGGEHMVVFSGRVFRYRKGDAVARAEVAEYARGVGVPEQQLDWAE
jgi:hypothetical protein